MASPSEAKKKTKSFSLKGMLLGSLTKVLQSSGSSQFDLFKLNAFFGYLIPWNRFHGITIRSLEEGKGCVSMRDLKKNHNHLGGLHACALATLAEYTSGLTLLRSVDASKYRLIMKRLEVDYHYQGRCDVLAECTIDTETLNQVTLPSLETEGTADIWLTAEVHDVNERHIATCMTLWQLKRWSAVKK